MRLIMQILKASGKRGVPQGGAILPLFPYIYLNEVAKMLEKVKEKTRQKPYAKLEYSKIC